jgi:hypothetical protein
VTDLTTVLGDAAAVVDPKGENEDISVLCGLVAWAVEHPDEYEGWDAETLSAAIRWNFGVDAGEADAMTRRLVEGVVNGSA